MKLTHRAFRQKTVARKSAVCRKPVHRPGACTKANCTCKCHKKEGLKP